MATYVVPPEQKETYTLTGAGTFTLTESQRSARSLTVLSELVLLSPPPRYFNFIYPEPQSFWGYVSWMLRDYVLNTTQLEYRRQVLLVSDYVEGERNRQLLCLLGVSQELAYLRLLDLMGFSGVPAEDRAVLYENWKTETDVKFLAQVRPETALWYEIVPGFALQLTIIWIPHWEACKPGQVPVFLPPPRGTNKDEQRPSDGGGGQQPVSPPPPGRTSDPLSDSPAPPPGNSTGPSSPVPVAPPNPSVRQVWRATPGPAELVQSGTGFFPISYVTVSAFGNTAKAMIVSFATSPGGPIQTQRTNAVPNAQYNPSLTFSPG